MLTGCAAGTDTSIFSLLLQLHVQPGLHFSSDSDPGEHAQQLVWTETEIGSLKAKKLQHIIIAVS